MEKRLDAAALEALIVEICAPWVQELDIKVLELGDNGAQFVMPATEKKSSGTAGQMAAWSVAKRLWLGRIR